MMIEFVNKNGGRMLVDDSRKEEYLRAGHKLALEYTKPEIVSSKPKPVRVKKARCKNGLRNC